jgi:nickel-dependent lactate racemase
VIVRLPFAKRSVVVDLRGFRVHALRPEGPRGVADTAGLVRRALLEPVAGRTFADAARGAQRVAVVVPDATRRADLPTILPVVLAALNKAGVAPDRVSVIVACGTHPPVASAEVRGLLGPLPEGVSAVQHDSRDDSMLEGVGTASTGLAVRLNRSFVEADFRVTIGAIRHHYFAGFGGGPKMVFPGVAGYHEIQHNHSRVLDLCEGRARRHPGCEPGRLAGNPVAEEIAEAAELCAAHAALCLVPGVERGFSAAFFGSPAEAFGKAVEAVREAFEIDAGPFDMVVGSGGGAPYDASLIQAHKGLDAACRFLPDEGGEALFAASLDVGSGSPDMEPFLANPSPEVLLASLGRRWVQYGHTTLRIVEKTRRHTVHLVSDGDRDVAGRLGFRPASSPEEVVDAWRERLSGASIGVMAGAAVYPRPAPNT